MAIVTENKPIFQVVQSEKFSEQISRQLLEKIVSGHFKAGDRLPPERDLAVSFNVSRVAVREALSSLGAKGILSVRQGRGTTVNPVHEWNTLDPDVLMCLHGDDVFDKLVDLRGIIEPELAALAAENITAEELRALRTVSDLPETDTMEQHVERDTTFHLLIAQATKNPVLLIVLSSITNLLLESRRRTFVVPDELPKSRECHHRIYAAIENHDPVMARQEMSGHMLQVKNALERHKQLELELN